MQIKEKWSTAATLMPFWCLVVICPYERSICGFHSRHTTQKKKKTKWIQYLFESQKYQFLWGVKLCSLLFSFVQHLGKRRKSEVKLAPLWCSKAASFFIWGQIVGLAAFFFYKKENTKQNQAHHHLLPCTYCTMYIYKFFWEWYLSKHPYVQRDTWHPAQMVLVIFLFPAL